METQAGIYKLTLYENKGFTFLYNSDGTIDFDTISNSGDVLEFETNHNSPKYSNNLVPAGNNQIINDYLLNLEINGYTQENLDTLEKLTSSIYGWIPLIEFMNNDKYLINVPFFEKVNAFNSQVTHTFFVELRPSVFSIRNLQSVVQSTGVQGLLDSTGSAQYVDLDSTPDVTGSKIITFEMYIPSTSTTSGESIISISDGGNDVLRVDFDNNNDDFRVAANKFLGFTNGLGITDISALKDTFIEVEIIKIVRSITSIKLNSVDNAVYSVSSLPVNTGARLYSTPHVYMWNLDINSEHDYNCQPNGSQDSAYIDKTGSIDGVVNGSPNEIDIP